MKAKKSVIVWKTKGFFKGDKSNEKNYGRFKFIKNGGMIDYITRSRALLLTNQKNEVLKEKFISSKSKYSDFLKSLNLEKYNPNNIPRQLFTFKNNKIVLQNLNEAKENFRKLKKDQYVWETYISIGKIAEDKLIFSEQVLVKEFEELLPIFFRKEGFKIDSLNVAIAFHVNTDNLHAHLIFHEKYKNFRDSKTGQLTFRKKGFLNEENIKQFKFVLEKRLINIEKFEELQKVKKLVWTTRKIAKELLKKTIEEKPEKVFSKNVLHINLFNSISKEIDKNKNWTFARMDSKVQQDVYKLFDEICKNDPKIAEKFDNYLKVFKHTLGIAEEIDDKNFKIKELDEFKKQIGNVITQAVNKYLWDDRKNAYGWWKPPKRYDEKTFVDILKKILNSFIYSKYHNHKYK